MRQPPTPPGRGGGTGRFLLVLALLAALLALGFLLNITLGSVSIAPGEVFSLLGQGLRALWPGGGTALPDQTTAGQILFHIRLPRLLLAAVLGGALSVSGYLLQVFFRNPIAGPFELGISSGAKMVVGITLVFLPGLLRGGALTLVGAAFLGSLLITGLLLVFSRRVTRMSLLLVIGIMIGYVCSAVTDICITFAEDHDIAHLTNWSMGSFSGADWGQVRTAAGICLVGLAGAWLLAKPMQAYALGEGYARSMGLRVDLFRPLLILCSSLLSACVTAFAGPISFVGVAVPHITRSLLRSSRPRQLIPAVFLCGGVFCVFCDLLARTLLSPTELKIGTVTAVFGAPVVISMMLKRKAMEEV